MQVLEKWLIQVLEKWLIQVLEKCRRQLQISFHVMLLD